MIFHKVKSELEFLKLVQETDTEHPSLVTHGECGCGRSLGSEWFKFELGIPTLNGKHFDQEIFLLLGDVLPESNFVSGPCPDDLFLDPESDIFSQEIIDAALSCGLLQKVTF